MDETKTVEIIRLEPGMLLREDVGDIHFIRPVTPAFAAFCDTPRYGPVNRYVLRFYKTGERPDGTLKGMFRWVHIPEEEKQ